MESRDGVYALGRYYVNSPSGSGQKVTYFADDWGYHPLVSYASTSSRGSSRTQFAMGDKAIAALKDVSSFPAQSIFNPTRLINHSGAGCPKRKMTRGMKEI